MEVKISEIAKEAAVGHRDVQEKAKELGITVKNNTVSANEAEKIFDSIKKEGIRKENKKQNNQKNRDNRRTKATVSKKRKDDKKTQEKSDTTSSSSSKQKSEQPKKREIKRPLKQKGLKIIKKKRPLKNKMNDATSTYGKLSEEARKEREKARKNSKKGISPKKKRQGEELEIFNQNFEENRFTVKDEEPKEVFLLDYRDQIILDEIEEKREEGQTKKTPKTKAPQGRNSKAGNKKQVLAKSVKKRKRKIKEEDEVVTEAEIPENIRVYEFAEIIKRPLTDVIKALFNLGTMVTKNDFLDGEIIEILAEEFEVEVTTVDVTAEFDYVKSYENFADSDEKLIQRAPIITIMGHVDHGKTSLLDKIRSTKVADREAGGITQHIGAYTIQHNNEPITFIDTPGHSAFSEMRKRGAKITDVVIIVVAGDDGVKPQTKEAIKYALEAEVPIIVAINKMDKEGANPDMVKAQVAEAGLNPVEWGGDTEFVPLSAKTGEGIDDLLEMIQIQAEVLELQANPDRNAKAVVIESSLEKGRGAVATVIVQNGTLKVGDSFVAGSNYGKVRMLLNDNKKPIKKILPGETGVIVGLNGVPSSGTDVVVTSSEKEAKELAEKRKQYERNKLLSKTTKASFDELGSMIAEGKLSTLKIILKTDVHGTLEAIKTSLESMRNEEVKVSIISEGVGGITENDLVLAEDSENIMIIGFNVRPTGSVKTMADKKGIRLKTYTVIYDIIDDVKNILSGMMKPIEEEIHTGQAEIKQLFKVKEGVVAGSLVVDGVVEKGIFARLIRNGVVLGDTTIHSLKRFKDEVSEVKKGYECGILLKDINDIAEGDIIETYKKVEKRAEI